MTSPYRSLEVRRDGFVAEVVMKGPGKGNALGPDFWRECPLVFEALSRDESVRAILLYGEGTSFTYGLDLKEMLPTLMAHVAGGGLAKQRTALMDLVRDLQRAGDAIEACRKPVVACIHGMCLGGGVDIATACDVRLASADAEIGVREVRVAMVADVGTLQRLPRIVGQGIARELCFTGKDIGAEHARRIQLVNEVYPDKEALLAAGREMARQIADNPPLVVAGIKEVLDFGERSKVRDREQFVAVWNAAFLASNDLAEAIAAFTERRPPVFKGE